MCTCLLTLSLPLLLAGSGGTGSSHEPVSQTDFERTWYDGQAEVNGYRWKGTRYGELRTGEAIAIFVTETLGAEDHVKVERPDEHRGATLTVLKLNLVRDFRTGLYDYDTMVTSFADVDRLQPLRQTFSSTEWCGQVFETLDLRGKELTLDVRSYFEGESARKTLPMKPDGITGEHLFVWLRGLRGHALAAGEKRKLPYLADPFERRLRHTEASWGELAVTRSKELVLVSGKEQIWAIAYELGASDGRTGKVLIEEAWPHRLLSWEWRRGAELLDSAILTGSKRMKYWELHAEGQEAVRKELGLE
jgi:hypothetical protein